MKFIQLTAVILVDTIHINKYLEISQPRVANFYIVYTVLFEILTKIPRPIKDEIRADPP